MHCLTLLPFLIRRLQKEKLRIRAEINKTDVTSLAPPLNEDFLIKELVAQFLTYDGYIETAKAFASEVVEETGALRREPARSQTSITIKDDPDAINRQSSHSCLSLFSFPTALLLNSSNMCALQLSAAAFSTAISTKP